MKIAMWSGPRNLSTAMMYAFAARGDCAAWDEPFYAAYLAATGLDHPLRAETLARCETDPARVADACAGPVPGDHAHWYMKHMPHHMQPGFPFDWAETCVNVHLIRHPARVIASYGARRAEMSMADIGFARQAEIVARLPGPVLDSADIRADPGAALGTLCVEIGLPFTPRMLAWPPGPRPFDGPWAPHWYRAVHASTGFAPAEGPLPPVPPAWQALHDAALPIYEDLRARALTPRPS